MRKRKCLVPIVMVILILNSFPSARATFVPWDALTADAWIAGKVTPPINLHTANGNTYPLGFAAAKNNVASGMNALTFSYGSVSTGHLASSLLTDSFRVVNTGGQTMNDLIILVAIDSPALPADFSLTLGVQGGAAYNFNPTADFAFYNHPEYTTGRPSGYYSLTSPVREGIAYNFDSGMVSLFSAPAVNVAANGSLTFNYAFNDLPGRAVFSVYGYRTGSTIQYTNRAVADAFNSTAAVSTFEVVPEPVSLILLGTGAVWLTGRKRRRCP